MYFNQLAKDIGIGQQAILRHLSTLEQSGFLEAYSEKSTLGAPDRKYYRLGNSFVLRISLSEDDFTINNQDITGQRQKEFKKHYEMFESTPKTMGHALPHLQENLSAVEHEILSLELRLSSLYALKQQILHKLHQVARENFDGNERKVLYKIVEGSPKSISELSDMANEKESSLRTIIVNMANKMDANSARILFNDLA